MTPHLWELHPRNKDLTRGGTLGPVTGWESMTLVERFNTPDTWVVEGPLEALGDALNVFQVGMGCILDCDGEQVTSGVVSNISSWAEVNQGTGQIETRAAVSFVSDLIHLYGRVVFPQPDKVLNGTPSAMSEAYDTRTGPIETLILEYVGANAGPAAPVTNRRIPGLALPAVDEERGGSTTVNARMVDLGQLVHDLAEAGRLRVQVQHDESTGTPRLLMVVEEAPDLSDDVRFGPLDSAATGVVETWRYEIAAPEATRAIAWAEGSLEERLGAQIIDTDSETLWGRSIERVLDVQWSSSGEEIARAMADCLNEGASPVTVSFTVAETSDVVYRRDFHVGAKVGVELPGLGTDVSDNVVREVTTTVAHGTETVSVVVGTPGSTTNSTRQAARLAKALRRLAALERST